MERAVSGEWHWKRINHPANAGRDAIFVASRERAFIAVRDKEGGRLGPQPPGGRPGERRIHSDVTPGAPLPGRKGPGRPLSLPLLRRFLAAVGEGDVGIRQGGAQFAQRGGGDFLAAAEDEQFQAAEALESVHVL